MKKYEINAVGTVLVLAAALLLAVCPAVTFAEKPGADKVLELLKNGNANFVQGKLSHPNTGKDRIALAAKSNQGDYALATIISCSDSRVPLEHIFDMGVMDLFVIRVAGNVCNVDEIGSAEYGVCHVKTPVLVVLGHSQCGAVTAVANASLGKGHALERNIPPLVACIGPAVQNVKTAFPQVTPENLINRSIEENVWLGIERIFMQSAAIREQAKAGKVSVVGALYDLESGVVKFLAAERVKALLDKAEAAPGRSTEVLAGGGHGEAPAHGEAAKPAEKKPEPSHGPPAAPPAAAAPVAPAPAAVTHAAPAPAAPAPAAAKPTAAPAAPAPAHH